LRCGDEKKAQISPGLSPNSFAFESVCEYDVFITNTLRVYHKITNVQMIRQMPCKKLPRLWQNIKKANRVLRHQTQALDHTNNLVGDTVESVGHTEMSSTDVPRGHRKEGKVEF